MDIKDTRQKTSQSSVQDLMSFSSWGSFVSYKIHLSNFKVNRKIIITV